jgi:hypothetical protein
VGEERLEVELECTECGAAFQAGLWDHSFRCSFCGSILVCARALGEEVFAVSDGGVTERDALALLIRSECESYRNELIGRAKGPDEEEKPILFPELIERQVEAFRRELEQKLELVEAHDFLVPYELHERTVFQGVLGRRGAAKESILVSFNTEDLLRRYDRARWNLRDRGLKIRGARLALLSERHRELTAGRALEAGAAPGAEPSVERADVQAEPGVQVISRVDGVCRERRLRLWKQMGFACVSRLGRKEHYLFDRQFATIAGQLSAEEAESFRSLAAQPLTAVVPKQILRAIASECPNCGHELPLPPRSHIAFCPSCALAIEVTADGLVPREYELASAPQAPAGSCLGFPFWAFPVRVRCDGKEFTRLWDWLELVSPQPMAVRFRENDPAQARVFVPARPVFGSRELDDAFAALAAVATWRQPTVRTERVQPETGLRLLDVELPARDAAPLAHFALVSLHGPQSTQRLNGMNFRKLVAEAEVVTGPPALAVVPLPIHGEHWLPAGSLAASPLAPPPFPRPVPVGVLTDDGSLPRRAKAFPLL